jgi:hypothetical protein
MDRRKTCWTIGGGDSEADPHRVRCAQITDEAVAAAAAAAEVPFTVSPGYSWLVVGALPRKSMMDVEDRQPSPFPALFVTAAVVRCADGVLGRSGIDPWPWHAAADSGKDPAWPAVGWVKLHCRRGGCFD